MVARRLRASRLVTVVTTGRSDYGLLRPVMRALRGTPGMRTNLLITGMHLSSRLGSTVSEIERDGLDAGASRVEMLLDSDSPSGAAKSMGVGMIGFAGVFTRERPDILVVLGDRFETLAVVAAALPFGIPVAHIHGGERTEGQMDDAVRHAITKLSHLHFVSNREHAGRVQQMGEERWRVVVSGAPGLDELASFKALSAPALSRRLGIPVDRRTLLVTYHPETARLDQSERDLRAILKAIDATGAPVVFTAPNADPGRDRLYRLILAATADRRDRVLVTSLGHQAYFSLMAHAGAMVGNSSSGLIEAPSFELPAVNIGGRQQGRVRARNVIDVAPGAAVVERAIRRALSPAFRRSLRGLRNPYGHGGAGRRIAGTLASVSLSRLLAKRFVDQ